MPGRPHEGQMPPQINLRKEIQAMVHRAIDSTVNYSGKEYEQNKHNWIEITTDRVIAAVLQSLPEPIDIRSKYEIGNNGGLLVDIGPDNSPEFNDQQIEYLAQYQADQGWNHYFFDYQSYLKRLYTIPEPVIQSEHDSNEDRIHGESEGDSPEDKEPSKVR